MQVIQKFNLGLQQAVEIEKANLRKRRDSAADEHNT